jgi:UDP-glucose 4-epimerase
MKVLVTGGAGFVGHHLVNKLIKKGYDVSVIDDLSTGQKKCINNSANFIQGDIRDAKALDLALEGCEVIFHLAARVELQKSLEDPADCTSVNVTGTANLIKLAIKKNIKKLIFASSCAVYPLSPKNSLSESVNTIGSTPYSISKIAGEDLLRFYSEATHIKSSVLRFFNIYGPGQKADSVYSAVIPTFINLAKKGLDLPLNGGGIQTRDFIHISDVINAYIVFLEKDIEGTYNIGTGKETSILDLAKIIIDFEKKSKILDKIQIPGDASKSLANMSKTLNETKFSSLIDIRDGLRSLYYN